MSQNLPALLLPTPANDNKWPSKKKGTRPSPKAVALAAMCLAGAVAIHCKGALPIYAPSGPSLVRACHPGRASNDNDADNGEPDHELVTWRCWCGAIRTNPYDAFAVGICGHACTLCEDLRVADNDNRPAGPSSVSA